jgi:hypothetical protein
MFTHCYKYLKPRIFLGFILASLFISPIWAQTTPSDPPILMLDLALGISNQGIAKNFKLSFPISNFLGSFYVSKSDEFFALSSPKEGYIDVGFLYGIAKVEKYWNTSLSSGASIFTGVRRGEYIPQNPKNINEFFSSFFSASYREEKYLTVGLPINATITWTPLSWLGIGYTFHTNINTEILTRTSAVYVQLGSLWPKHKERNDSGER